MHTHKGKQFWLNNSSGQWFYSFKLEERLKPLKAKDFKTAINEVEKIIEKTK